MRLLKILKTNGTSVPIKAKSPSHMLPILTLAAVLAPRLALAQHDGGRMGGGGYMGGGGWTDPGGMWLWTVVAILVIVLLVVLITKQVSQK